MFAVKKHRKNRGKTIKSQILKNRIFLKDFNVEQQKFENKITFSK